jgi:hypothetical protein
VSAIAARVFLLSPARLDGRRSTILVRPPAKFELAERLHRGEATIGEVYSFISGLYFRGKVAYAGAFGAAPEGGTSSLIIVPGAGLIPLETTVSVERVREFAGISIERDYDVYRATLQHDARLLEERSGPACRFILLGSIASGKYTAPLLEVFGDRLMFPADFVGRGDMSRGGLMLRSAQTGVELEYKPVAGALLRGSRPPKLIPTR